MIAPGEAPHHPVLTRIHCRRPCAPDRERRPLCRQDTPDADLDRLCRERCCACELRAFYQASRICSTPTRRVTRDVRLRCARRRTWRCGRPAVRQRYLPTPSPTAVNWRTRIGGTPTISYVALAISIPA